MTDLSVRVRKMEKKKNEKKNEVSVKKLESEFHDFQKEWQEFLTNDFHHLVINVNTLVKQNDGMRQDITKLSQNIHTIENCMRAMDEGIMTLIKRGQ